MSLGDPEGAQATHGLGIPMLSAPKHTVPVCLFELHNGSEAPNVCASDRAPGSLCPPRRENHRKSRARTAAAHVGSDRFGPGRLSRRHHQTERLRELRTRLSSGFTHGTDITPLPLSKDPVVVCDDALASSNKRRRGPSGAARQLLRQRFSENASVPLALVQKSTLLAGPTGARASEQPLISGEDAGAHDDFGDGGRNESGVNARTCGSRGRGFANHDGADGVLYLNTDRRTCKSSTTSEVANFDRGGTRCILAPGSKSSIGPLVILPVRSAPASRRPRAAKSAVGMPRSMLDTQGDKKTAKQCARSRGTQRAKTALQYTRSSKQPRGDGDASENDDVGIAGFSGGEHDTDGEYYGTLPGSECAPLAPPGSSINTPGLGYPGIVGACGGIVLRLTPAERSLEPWSSVVSPLRAMCDIEPSLSRAGLECREVINAVEAAQEMKSQDRAKRKLARNAKSLLGSDVRPRTSEPRLGIAGVTTELDVMKSIIVRERLIVTLRRLVRRLRRHCHKLQDRLRWEAKFRRCYGKSPPDELTCATSMARKILHVEQKELRVVLAHLRAISFDTVDAVSKWRATFVTSRKEGYRQLRSSGSFSLRQSANDRGLTVHGFSQAGQTYEDREGDDEGDINHNRSINHSATLGVLQSSTSEEKLAGDTTAELGTDPNRYIFDGDNETYLKKRLGDEHSRPIFRWKGRNYLVKMARDLEFLDDTTASAPVTAWLGFSVRDNPFLLPPDNLDVCAVLLREHEQRHEEIVVRRRLQRRKDSNRRRNSRSRTNSTNNSTSKNNNNTTVNINSNVSTDNIGSNDIGSNDNSNVCGDGNDPSWPPLYREHTPEQPGRVDNDAGGGQEPTALPEPRHSGVSESNIQSRATGGEKPLMDVAGDDGVGAFWMSEVGDGSTSTTIDPQLPGFGSFESEGITCELSSGEEEEVRWGGEGHLDFPLIPALPESIRCKGVTAEGVLRDERASEEFLESRTRELLADARRAGDILREPSAKCSSRLESLALRSSTQGLKGTLKERHVGISRLISLTDFSGWEEGQRRRVFTAPPTGSGGHRRRTRAATASESSLAGTTAFGGRGGVRVTADGLVADVVAEDPAGGCTLDWGTLYDKGRSASAGVVLPSSLASARSTGRCFRNTGSPPPCAVPFAQRRSPSSPRAGRASSLSHLDIPGSSVEGRTSAVFPAEWSTAPSSLQASSSSMSARARARAVTDRPTATRRPCRNGGKTIIIPDPARSMETSRLAACLIQAAFLGVRDRLFVRRLREKRLLASALIRRMWRRWRVRADKWEVVRWQRVERLRKTVEDRKRDRAAHSITIFFRDISYQKQRDRHARFLRDRDSITREFNEQVAAIVIQGCVRRFQNCRRTEARRKAQRDRAQARIARAARERAAYVRLTTAEERSREEPIVFMGDEEKEEKIVLVPGEAAVRIQAWLRGTCCRRMVPANWVETQAKNVFGQGSTSANLRAALAALEGAQSVARGSSQGRTKETS